MRLRDSHLAKILGTNPAQVARWASRGIDVTDPDALLAALSTQHRTGATFILLSDPAERRRVAAQIAAIQPEVDLTTIRGQCPDAATKAETIF